jgi:hypothetical protein
VKVGWETYAVSRRFHESFSGLTKKGMRTLMGRGLLYRMGRMTASGMPIARSIARVSVTAKAITRSFILLLGVDF